MVKRFTGRITDAETGNPLPNVHIWPLRTREGGVITDLDGYYHLAVDDGTDIYFQPWSFDLVGYGNAVISGAKYLDDLEYSIYKTDAPVIVKAKAILKNSFISVAVSVLVIILLIKISKRFI